MNIDLLIALYFYSLIGVAVYFFAMSALNVLDIRRNTVPPPAKSGPLVSVMVPVRDESRNIGQCLAALRAQDYENYEILVIDDNSTDGTWEIISKIAAEDERVKIYKGKPLPGG